MLLLLRMFALLRSLRRRWLARRPLDPAWLPLIAQHFPFADALPADERERFLLHLRVFARDKVWEGSGGLEVTDEMKVVVSGSAARLSRNLSLDVYDDLVTVLLYPSSWKDPRGSEGVHLGEAHRWGLVVFAWDAVRHGLVNPVDGHDTALHEFAHVLDLTDGRFDGTPELQSWTDYHAWATVFSKHYEKLRARPHRHELLRAYGATNEAEFFAVATEAFFEKPRRMQEKAPELYAELKRYYRLDPVKNGR